MKIIGHIGHFRWLGPNVWWEISQIWIEYIKRQSPSDKCLLNHESFSGTLVMAWCHQATSYYLSLCWPRSILPYGIARPQWMSQANLIVRITLCMCSLVQGVITLSQLWHPTETVDNLPLSLTAREEAAPKSPFVRGCLYHMYDKQTSISTKMPSDKILENWQLYNACKTGWSEANWTILEATATH